MGMSFFFFFVPCFFHSSPFFLSSLLLFLLQVAKGSSEAQLSPKSAAEKLLLNLDGNQAKFGCRVPKWKTIRLRDIVYATFFFFLPFAKMLQKNLTVIFLWSLGLLLCVSGEASLNRLERIVGGVQAAP
jgi:hypothetical protein